MPTTAPPRPPETPRPMDPRIRQRRIEVTRIQGRRRLKVLVAFVGTFLAGGVALALVHSPWLSVGQVRVEGVSGAQGAAVAVEVSGLAHRPMIEVSGSSTAARVARLPWVAGVRVWRSWPRTVVVAVAARRAVAQVAHGPLWSQLDAGGRVIAEGPQTALPVLDGVAGAAPGRVVRGHGDELALAARLPSAVAPRVTRIGSGTDGGPDLWLSSGAEVLLGPPGGTAAELSALQTVLAEVDMTGVTQVDLRLPDQPVLTRR
ncbi:MAG TPA: cell division protein FtsQ/DivIB [Acidimicrobiales bacterium]|nr:cell division protein FtsQ/DivIB [Acidimicrobiales bacterium]